MTGSLIAIKGGGAITKEVHGFSETSLCFGRTLQLDAV